MPIEGIIILIVTIIALIVPIIVGAVWGWRPKLPKGHKFEAEYNGNKVILVVEEDIPTIKSRSTGEVTGWVVETGLYLGDDLAKKCAMAMQTAELAFKEKGLVKANIKKYIVHFQSDKSFETFNQSPWWQNWAKNVAAYSNRTKPNWFGPTTAGCVIRAKHMKSLVERGQPVIHELIHSLSDIAGSGYQRGHDNKDLWNAFGTDTVEAIGERQWKDQLKL